MVTPTGGQQLGRKAGGNVRYFVITPGTIMAKQTAVKLYYLRILHP